MAHDEYRHGARHRGRVEAAEGLSADRGSPRAHPRPRRRADEASLAAGEYYAFRHNQFWRIACEICGVAPEAPYVRRKAALKRRGIALWDVVPRRSAGQPRLRDPRRHPARQRFRRLPRGAPAHPPCLLQRPQGGVGLAAARPADASGDAHARVHAAAVDEPHCRDGLSFEAQGVAERNPVLNRRQILQGLRRGRARRCVRSAAARRDRHAGRARHRRRRRRPHGRARADGAGHLGARARSARPHRRPRLHRKQPGHRLGSRRSHVLEIDSWVADHQLRLDWRYSTNVHRQRTIELLAESFLEHLGNLICHCASRDVRAYTPSDFAAAGLNQVELDRLIADLG